MATAQKSLERQSREQALGIASVDQRDIQGGGAFKAGAIDHVRVRAYYPPTRRTYDVTPQLVSLTWTDSVDQAAVEAQMTFDNADGEATEILARVGMVYFIETRAEGRKFNERLRVTAWTVTVGSEDTLEVVAYDCLFFLQIATGHSFLYHKDKTHKKGWRAHEIALDIIRDYNIPVAYKSKKEQGALKKHQAEKEKEEEGKDKEAKRGPAKDKKEERQAAKRQQEEQARAEKVRIVRTKYQIPYWHTRDCTLYEALAKPYEIDRKQSGRHYYIEAIHGRVAILRKPRAQRVMALTPDMILDYSFTRDLSESFGTVLIPLGADKKGDKKRHAKGDKKHKQTKAKDGKKQQAAKEQEKKKKERERKGRIKEAKQSTITMLLGNIIVGKGLGNVRDADWTNKEAQRMVDALARAVKTLTITAPGNVFVKQGDRLYVRIPLGPKRYLRKDLFVASVTHSLTAGEYTMDLELRWRQRSVDLDVPVDSSELQKGGGGKGKGKEEGGEGTGEVITGKVSYFGGNGTAGGKQASSDAGLALNLNPGTEGGWDNATTRGWMAKSNAGNPVMARVQIQGHTATLPIIDLGPAASTGRAIDVTEPGVRALGFSTSNFPTDAFGRVEILG